MQLTKDQWAVLIATRKALLDIAESLPAHKAARVRTMAAELENWRLEDWRKLTGAEKASILRKEREQA